MNDRLKDLFSTERLNSRWESSDEEKEAAAVFSTQALCEIPEAIEQYLLLREEISRSCNVTETSAPGLMLAQLKDLIDEAYPQDAEEASADGGEETLSAPRTFAEVAAEIEILLNKMEDLFDALRLGGLSR